jgi:hypothetical protein
MQKHIYLLSASDRFNYGDVLFPIVAKHELQKLGDFEFHNVATISSNLVECGAMPTLSYRALLNYEKIPDDSTLIVAGGEVLTANWSRLISFTKEYYDFIFRKWESPRLEKIAKFLFGKNEVSFPFIPSAPALLEKYRVVYHAVGGRGTHNLPNQQQEIVPAIKAAEYFSAREPVTQKQIANNFKIDVTLVPDSVLVLSDMCPKEQLVRPLTAEYVCVQFGFVKSEARMPAVLKELRKIHQTHNIDIGLLSIGNCPGHDDMKSVEWIKQHADFPVVELPSNTIDQITSAIAHAKIFIGTSLHGAIVSMSYGNPFVAVHKKIHKLEAYTQQWAPDYLKGNVDFANIANETNKRLKAHVGYEALLKEQKMLVRQSFERIAKIASR